MKVNDELRLEQQARAKLDRALADLRDELEHVQTLGQSVWATKQTAVQLEVKYHRHEVN